MPLFDTEVPALLLRLDHNPFHHGTLGAVRSLGRAGIEVHAFVESPRSPVARSRYLHGRHHLPADLAAGACAGGEDADDRLEAVLHQVSECIGRPAVLVPMDDAGAIAAARLADRLCGRFLLPAQPHGLPQRLADKAELVEVCRETGVPHPPTEAPGSARELAEALRRLGLPAVAKWSRPWLLPRGSGLRSTTVVRTAEEARGLYGRSGEAGCVLLLQQYLPGGQGTDWFFHGCFAGGADGPVCLLGGTGRKDRSWPVGAGLTAVGRWLPNPEVEEAAHRMAGRLGYRGILDLDFRYDAVTGTHRLLDFNPRPGAQFRLFTDRTGMDVVRALHLDLTGRTAAPSPPVPGRVFVAENYALVSSLASLPARTPRSAPPAPEAEAVTDVRDVETAWFAADDPAPFLAMTAAWFGQGGRKALRRRGRGGPRGAAADRTGLPPGPPGPERPAPGRSGPSEQPATTTTP